MVKTRRERVNRQVLGKYFHPFTSSTDGRKSVPLPKRALQAGDWGPDLGIALFAIRALLPNIIFSIRFMADSDSQKMSLLQL